MSVQLHGLRLIRWSLDGVLPLGLASALLISLAVGCNKPRDDKEVVNSVGMKFREIPAGRFRMSKGSLSRDEQPHLVSITDDYFIGTTEVTNSQWNKVMGANPSKWKAPDGPVESVSWLDAVEFCKELSNLPEEIAAGRGYRLPTEAEWEYACRAQKDSCYHFGNKTNLLDAYGWFDENSGEESHAVGKKQPNQFGLLDMHGNVWEWCSDWYGALTQEYRENPQGPDLGRYRVYRGGGWNNIAWSSRTHFRYRALPSLKSPHIGFRVVLTNEKRLPGMDEIKAPKTLEVEGEYFFDGGDFPLDPKEF